MSVKLQPAPKCETPAAFRGLLVKKLKVGQDLHCDTPLQPLLELKPDQDQVKNHTVQRSSRMIYEQNLQIVVLFFVVGGIRR